MPRLVSLAPRQAASIFGTAVLARLAYWVWVTPDWLPVSDADQYVRLARSVASGDGYSLVYPQLALHATAFRPPLYPALLVVPSWLFGDALWPVRLVNLILGSAVAVLAALLAARIAGRRAGWVTGLLVAVYPPLLANDTVSLTEPLSLVLLLGLLLFLDDERWVLAGVMVGAMLLTRPNAYLVVVFLVVVVLKYAGWRMAAFATAACVAIAGVWVVRDMVQVGTPRLVTSDGFTLAAIYAPHAQEADRFVDPVFDPLYDNETDLKWSQFDEATWADALTRLAIDGVKDDPRFVGHVVKRNLGTFFELDRDKNDIAESLDGRNLDFRNAFMWSFFVVTILGVTGLVLARRDRRAIWLMIVVGQFAVLNLLTVSPPRLRAPFDLACCIGVGLAVAEVTRRARARDASGVERETEPAGSEREILSTRGQP